MLSKVGAHQLNLSSKRDDKRMILFIFHNNYFENKSVKNLVGFFRNSMIVSACCKLI